MNKEKKFNINTSSMKMSNKKCKKVFMYIKRINLDFKILLFRKGLTKPTPLQRCASFKEP